MLLVTAPFVIIISRLMIFRNVARTSARFPSLIVLGAAGVLLASWGYARGGEAGEVKTGGVSATDQAVVSRPPGAQPRKA